jgi:alpha-tubulin suppressor-like RCC1 family protein
VSVVAMAAGDDHSLVLTDKGTVLSFGAGECGQLGHVSVGNTHQPCRRLYKPILIQKVVPRVFRQCAH